MGFTASGQGVTYQGPDAQIICGGIIPPPGGGNAGAIPIKGPLTFSPDNTFDIGSPDAGVTLLRPRNIFVGSDVQTGTPPSTVPLFSIPNRLTSYAYGAVTGVRGYRVNGTPAAPTATLAGNSILSIMGSGYESVTPALTATGAGIFIVATENYTNAAQGTRIDFHTTLTGTVTRATRWQMLDLNFLAAVDNTGDIGSPDAGVTLLAPRKIYQYSNVILADAAGAVTSGLCFLNQTNGAAAQAGTLANAPVAGNPTFWLPVNIGGALKHIPAW